MFSLKEHRVVVNRMVPQTLKVCGLKLCTTCKILRQSLKNFVLNLNSYMFATKFKT